MFITSQNVSPQKPPGARSARAASTGISLPDRACCCAARPMVLVEMPPTDARPLPADLWMCLHHYHKSRTALTEAGAEVFDLSGR